MISIWIMVTIPHAKYYEGIMQLRDCEVEVVAWVRQRTRKDDRALITKEKKVRGGIDLYFSSQKYLRTIGKKLSETFAGEYKTTRTLHTRSKMGRELYRVTVLFRQYPFKKGDTLEYCEEKFEVLSFGNQVYVKNLGTGKKSHIKLDVLRTARKL